MSDERAWNYFDDRCLTDLQGIAEQIKAAAFSLECLCQRWERMPDDDAEPVIEQLRESFAAVDELFENFKELQENANA